MVILSDIVINGCTTADIIIDGLIHRLDMDRKDLLPSAIVLKTNADVIPYVVLLDCSIDKKDSILLPLESYCGKISNSMIVPIEQDKLSLIASIDKCQLKTFTDASSCDFNLIGEADVVAYSYLSQIKYDELSLKSYITEDLLTMVHIYPFGCKLSQLDDMYLSELDPMPILDIDTYGMGTKLILSDIDFKTIVNIDNNTFSTKLQSSIDISVSLPIQYYDDYSLTEFDEYTLDDLGRGIF